MATFGRLPTYFSEDLLDSTSAVSTDRLFVPPLSELGGFRIRRL
jgi:hypothetical protein